MTLTELKTMLEALGLKLIEEGGLYGFCFKNKYLYHWFEKIGKDDYLYFHHSYSQNTGNSFKSWNKGNKVKRSLLALYEKQQAKTNKTTK